MADGAQSTTNNGHVIVELRSHLLYSPIAYFFHERFRTTMGDDYDNSGDHYLYFNDVV